tara:strand:+ start:1659 stop:2486 length:828 start_codon:yes stop_codon:yes gene_type:complete
MEAQYLRLLAHVLETGAPKDTRNGRVLSNFGAQLHCDLSEGFPLLTTKKMFWRGIVEELSWFLRGSTNVQELRDKRVHIWDGNSSERGYDAGPVYGFQWRHFGAEYGDCHVDYTGQGVDQIANIIELLRNEPHSRRMVLSAWCPTQQADMCLPPCHVMYQFYVESDGRVSCMMTQRSADVFLGLPFNIASTALLTALIAHQVGREPGQLFINIGDAHIYEEHVDACRLQLSRSAFSLSSIRIERPTDDALWCFGTGDVVLMNYKCHDSIKAPMKA